MESIRNSVHDLYRSPLRSDAIHLLKDRKQNGEKTSSRAPRQSAAIKASPDDMEGRPNDRGLQKLLIAACSRNDGA
ncbi:hypothetical protein CEXT_808471 [Caerostris extrusa]|uniref:Uncharacterized protein n=1 Tax=Caerostris extrusa TaxID=172846 RepID=A0AAV4S844_CAEEX|nr:hypothetical protein CEXT_808471 [Caerostris extrusa]